MLSAHIYFPTNRSGHYRKLKRRAIRRHEGKLAIQFKGLWFQVRRCTKGFVGDNGPAFVAVAPLS